jgi:hypothetical protein
VVQLEHLLLDKEYGKLAGSVEIAKPNSHTVRSAIYVRHHFDLAVLLWFVILVDADCIDPYMTVRVCMPKSS